MASLDLNQRDGKASSLSDGAGTYRSSVPEGGEGKGNARKPDPVRGNRKWVTLVVDLILLAVLVGLAAGGVFAYRAIRDLYAPVWESRDVVFCVKMEGIDPSMVKYGQDGRSTFTGNPIWSSDRTDADLLGTVTDVRTVLVSREDGYNTITMYLTVEATAHYREGKGYRMGATMLLAGDSASYRVEGMVAEGSIISMHEKSMETDAATEAGTVLAEPPETDPDAQG